MRPQLSRIGRTAAAFGALFLGGCESKGPRAPSADGAPDGVVQTAMDGHVVGWRYLDTLAEGAVRPVLDPEKALHLMLTEPPAPGVAFTLEFGSGERVPLQASATGARIALSAGTALAVGEAAILAHDGETSRRWPVRFERAQPESASVRSAAAACRGSEPAQGLAALETLRAAAPAREAHWLLVERARCLQGARRQDEALEAWKAAAEAAGAASLPTERARRLRAAAFVAIQARRLSEARVLLDSTRSLDASPDPARRNEDGEARTAYNLGLLEGELGNVRQAVARTEEAVRRWTEIGLEGEADWAREWLVHQYQRAGQFRQATALLAGMAAPPPTRPADRARFLHNRAWFHLEEMQRGARPRDFPAVRLGLTTARDLFRQLGNPDSAAEAEVNLAWVAFLEGDHRGAARGLASLEQAPGGLPRFSAPFVRLLRGELALAAGDTTGARTAFQVSARAAREESGGLDSEERWRALYGEGRARRAAHDAGGAGQAFAAALETLERVGQRTLLRETRAGFFDDRHALVDDAVSLALERGDAEAAFAIVVRTQARILRGLESTLRPERLGAADRTEWDRRVETWARARETWEAGGSAGRLLSARRLAVWQAERETQRLAMAAAFDAAYAFLDQAAPDPVADVNPAALRARLAPDELLLDFHRIRGQAWVFRIARDGVTARAANEKSASTLLEGLEFAGAHHLYLVPGDVQGARAIPVFGEVNGILVWKTHGVSLLPHAGLLPTGPPSAVGQSVIVADPAENLPAARAEGEALARAIPGARLLVGAAALRSAVLDGLDGAPLFHFSGHGFIRADDPWDARLGLAGAQSLTFADVLVRRARPGLVVLSGCETGAAAPVGLHESVGLPDAFLAGGAYAVLATERTVGDLEARRFIERFNRAYLGASPTPAQAWRAALAGSVEAGETGHEAFRLFGGR